VFQEFATLDLLSRDVRRWSSGAAHSFDAFPLFGLSLDDYDALFEDKLDLLLKVRDNEHVTGPAASAGADGTGRVPTPVQQPLPIWLGVGGTPKSFAARTRWACP